ncbi:RNA 2',3'-cyclic phosphodiesterase [soil metagenome]
MIVAGRKRLFFAIWPDDASRRDLHRSTRRLVRVSGGKPVPLENLHLTLAFLHSIELERLPCIRDAARGVEWAPFELIFDRAGFWPRPRLLWAAPSRPDAGLAQLVGVLWKALEPCGFVAERRAYLPHVTLARKVGHTMTVENITPVTWRVDRFQLAESIPGGSHSIYRILNEWRAGGSAGEWQAEARPTGRS